MSEQKTPFVIELEADKSYAWCVCGKSAHFPYCDGAHQGTEFKPVIQKVDEKTTVGICSCGKSGNGVYCDGTHTKI